MISKILKTLAVILGLLILLYIGAYIYIIYKIGVTWCKIYTGEMTPDQANFCAKHID